MADGPGFGVTVIATADRPGAIPGPVAGLVADRLVFRLADPYDYAAFGLRPPAGRVPPWQGDRGPDRARTSGRLFRRHARGGGRGHRRNHAAPHAASARSDRRAPLAGFSRRVDRPGEIRWPRMAGAGRDRRRLPGSGEPHPGRRRACARRRPTEIGPEHDPHDHRSDGRLLGSRWTVETIALERSPLLGYQG